MAFLLLCSLLSMSEAFFRPLIVQRITDKGMLQGNYSAILIFSILLIGMIFGVQGLEIVQNQQLLKIKNDVMHRLYVEAFEKMLRLKIGYFAEKNSAEIINQLNTDISCAGILLDKGVIYMFNYVLRIVSGFVGLFYLNGQMALCIIACIPVKLALLHLFSKKKEGMTAAFIEKSRSFDAWTSDKIMGIREIKLLNRYKREKQIYAGLKGDLLEQERKLDLLGMCSNSAETLIQGMMTAVYYLIGGYYVCTGRMSVGSVLAFISYSGNVTGPISMIMNMKMLFAQIKPSFMRMQEFFDLEEEKSLGAAMSSAEELEADRISFSYGERAILREASFRVKRGERIAVVGENGSGKSTMLNLLLRFYEPKAGEIRVDGKKAESLDLTRYRQLFAVVTQFPYLFQETVRENLDNGRGYSDEEIREAFFTLHMEELYRRLPEGLDTVIGVNAANLSGGEKQKLALIRAWLQDAPILILDEATSNYDQESEEWLFAKGLELFRDRMVILVTHQPQYLGYCDRVYRLENGSVWNEKEQGGMPL